MSNSSVTNLLTSLKFCVFDLETTGGDQKNDKIIEIGLIKIDNLKIIGKKSYLINPEKKIPDFIQRLTSIKQSSVENCQTIEDVIDDILIFIEDRILVAHNASFDVPFLNSMLKRLNKEKLKNKSICTNLMTKYLIPTLVNSNLNHMSKIFNITHKNAHRALDDADATAKLFLNYLKIYQKKGIRKINHLYYPKNRYELDLLHFKKEINHIKEIKEKIKNIKVPYLITLKGKNGVPLFSFPCEGSSKENEYLYQKIKLFDWTTISIKLMGPFFEAFIKFNHSYLNLENEVQEEIIQKLWLFHLDKLNKENLLKNFNRLKNKYFIIMNHLVPDQYTIYPFSSLRYKNELVFRYPGHEKKLIQYINAKIGRMNGKKTKTLSKNLKLQEFSMCYIAKCYLENKKLLFINKITNEEKYPLLFKKIDQFSSENPNPYNYPKYYI